MPPSHPSAPASRVGLESKNWTGGLDATRASLLSRLRRHDDRDAWQRFFDTYAGVIHACARKAGLSATEADEALQETLLSVAREIPGFCYDPAKGSFKSWLFRIARRRIADQFRRRGKPGRAVAEPEGLLQELPDPRSDPLTRVWEDEWKDNQFQRAVEEVRSKVAARQWQMFDLASLKRWPTERICATLGVNRAQVYMARMRVGRALREAVRALQAREDL